MTGDADAAIEELYAAHWAPLVRLAVLMLKDQAAAEDVVQDAFVAVHRRWSRMRDHDRALAYLRRAVVNGATSALRRRTTASRYLAREAGRTEAAASSETLTVEAQRREAVLDAVRALPDRQREVIALRYYVGLSEAEIAQTLGIARGSVKSHASRGAAALRASLGHQLEEI